MTSEDIKRESDKDDTSSIPAFAVSGQFMMTSEEKAVPSEEFNPRKIVALTLDDSLARLFECLTLEYSGSILLTPKWKNFRSQKLKFAEKTRINNAIWRSWHIQFKEGKRPLFCQFDNPLAEMAKKPRPVTLMIEGKYWKRKLEAVATEYQKWRVFYKQMVEDKFQDVELQHQTEEILRLDQEISDSLRERENKRKYSLANQKQQDGGDMASPISHVVSQAMEMVDSCNLMENMVFTLPDTLFSSLTNNQVPGKVRSGTFKDTADMVQPTLDTLQPSLEAMTPVLDELIEQLEASMKGSELSWDFETLERNYNAMGIVQSSNTPVVEPMDHSGQYNHFETVGMTMTTSSPIKTSWPNQNIQHSLYRGNSIESQLPIWTSAPIVHPNFIGYQTVKMQGSQNEMTEQNVTRRSQVQATSIMDVGVSNSPITSRPYLPPTGIGRRLQPIASVVETPTSRLPRNSSDSQLYLLAAGENSSRSHLPVELQAPNLVAQLKLNKPRQMLIEEKAKKIRLPRNKSAPGLASLDSTSSFRKVPQVGGVRAKRLGRIPRNRSDSALASLLRQSESLPNRSRRDSESSDTPPTMEVTSSETTRRLEQTVQGFPKHQICNRGGQNESSQPPSQPPSQLVQEMVSHLVNKGISMEDILNKLTSMAASGTVPQAQAISNQINSAASDMASLLQEHQLQSTSISKPPPNSTVLPSRNRRKAQVPRPNVKAETSNECEKRNSTSNNFIVQNLLAQNKTSSSDYRVANIESPSTSMSNARWGNESITMTHGLAARTLAQMAEPLSLQNKGSYQFPMDISDSNISRSALKDTGLDRVDTSSPGGDYLPSMVINQSSILNLHSEGQASTSKTITSNKREGPSTPTNLTNVEATSQNRSGALIRTLPKEEYKEHRRMVHVSAEQKRRGHIKMGFDQLVDLVPALASQGSAKISKASILRKSVDFILQVQQEQEFMRKERDSLRQDIDQLNIAISHCQQQLPETGVLVNRQDKNEMDTLFNRYVKERTEENPKFWIFSVLMRPLFNDYSSTVSTGSQEEFYRTVLDWMNESCSLPKLRPSVLASLRELIKNTSILSDPSKFPEQARLAANTLCSQTHYSDNYEMPR